MRRAPVLPLGDPDGDVPKIFHQIWVGSEPPAWVLAHWKMWDEALDDSWTIHRWTDENRDQWPICHRVEEFCKHPVILSDFIRIEQLMKMGGIYMDTDTVPVGDMDQWAGPGVKAWLATAGRPPHPKGRPDKPDINNAIFGFPPGHPYLAEIWQHAFEKVQTIKNAYYIAGPKVYDSFLDVVPGVRLPDWKHFPDLPRKHRYKGFDVSVENMRRMYPEATAVHLGNNSWFGANNSMTDTNTFIMAVPWEERRAARARELADQTRAQIVWDQTHNAFDTWRSVLKAVGDEPGIILEDDIYLVPNWRTRIEEVISEHPDEVIQFFSMRGKDLTEGSRSEPGRTFMMNQCYYLPAGVAKQLLEFSETWVEENPKYKTGYDVTMAKWMQQNKMRYWLHVPSLVQHEPWVSEINARRPRNRQSQTFEGV